MKRLTAVAAMVLMLGAGFILGHFYRLGQTYETPDPADDPLLAACERKFEKKWQLLSQKSVEPLELVLADHGVPECVAYAKARMSPAVERELTAIRLQDIGGELTGIADTLNSIDTSLDSIERNH